MSVIKNRKIVFLKVRIDDTGRFSYNFHIPFFVDDVIIKDWSCAGTAFDDVVICHMDGIGDIFSFEHNNSITINHVFNVHRNMDGIINFTINDYEGDQYTDAVDSILMACFEFIEYVR
jgi:hypothetical protein